MASTSDVAIWITREMQTNVAGSDVAFIRSNLSSSWTDSIPNGVGAASQAARRLLALQRFYELVRTGGVWDHKRPIRDAFGEWSDDTTPPRQYRYDIWSNVHYGYIGLACGFGQDILLDAAGAAQRNHGNWDAVRNITNLRTFDDPLDQEAIKVGFRLWDVYAGQVQAGHTLGNVRAYGSRLATRAVGGR